MTTDTTELTFTLDELLQALSEAVNTGQGRGRTTMELAAQLGISDATVRLRLRPLIASGKVRHVKEPRRKMNGVVNMTDCYEFVKDVE